MRRFVEFQLDQGGSFVVTADEPPLSLATHRLEEDRSGLAAQADQTFEYPTATATPAVDSLITWLRLTGDTPNEAGIDFGV